MKKLIAFILPLFTAATALAEESIGIIGGADGPTAIFVAAETETTLLGKGLLVTAGGLFGTFLVLILFYLTIKLMQKFVK